MPGPDPREWSDNEWIDREFVDYELSPYEKRAITQIKENVARNLYTDPANCYKHLELLEDLANKLRSVVANERSLGKANWDVEQTVKDIKELYSQLYKCYEALRKG